METQTFIISANLETVSKNAASYIHRKAFSNFNKGITIYRTNYMKKVEALFRSMIIESNVT